MNEFEKIKERLEEESQYSCSHCMERAITIVSEVEAEYGNGWIPCSKRLPEKENVLCYAVSLARNTDTIFVGAYSNGVWFLQSAIATISYPTQYKVIAWTPLPSPYKPTTD